MEGPEKEAWDDHRIDNEAKVILKEKKNGEFIPSDAISHLEFFYNTLLMSHITENPFDHPQKYLALQHKECVEQTTLLDIHRKITQPRFYSEKTSDLSSVSSLSKKYDWYPNNEIEPTLVNYTSSPLPSKTYGDRRGTQQFSL